MIPRRTAWTSCGQDGAELPGVDLVRRWGVRRTLRGIGNFGFHEPGQSGRPFLRRPVHARARAKGGSGSLATVVIHEELHSLGLGENPPSSQEITRRVESRCGF